MRHVNPRWGSKPPEDMSWGGPKNKEPSNKRVTCLLFIMNTNLHGYAPTYLKNLINSRSVSERYSLRVNDDNWLLQTVTSLNFAISQSMFSYASPKVWNSLPLSLREIETLSLFKKRLKAFYFNLAFEDITTVWCQYFAAYCCRISTSVEY